MRSNIAEVKKALAVAEAFTKEYDIEDAFLYINSDEVHLSIDKSNAALAGKVFGKDGWIRHLGYGGLFDWDKVVMGVKVCIRGVETLDINDTPVPAKAFPIELTNGEA